MAKSELFSDIGFTLADEATGNLAAFSTEDYSQLVIQATATANVSFVLQVSPDGANWFEVLGGTVSVSAGGLTTASADVTFAQARFRYVVSGTGPTASVRVLGRL